MKVKIVKSLQDIEYNSKDENSGKAWVLNDLIRMERKFGMVEVDFRAYIIYAPHEILLKCMKYLDKLERRGLVTIDRSWADVDLEHHFVAKRVRTLMWRGVLRDSSLSTSSTLSPRYPYGYQYGMMD